MVMVIRNSTMFSTSQNQHALPRIVILQQCFQGFNPTAHLCLFYRPLKLSDLDARVIDELLSDPAFLGSLVEQGVQLEESGDDGGARMVGNNTIASSSSNALLSVAGEGTPTPKSSDYESVTMQVVEGLQDSVKGVLAKVSAAFESAGDVLLDGG